MIYQEFAYYSVLHDADMVRLSTHDGKGGEFFATYPALGGRKQRDAKEQALLTIETAKRMGLEPGEVRIAA